MSFHLLKGVSMRPIKLEMAAFGPYKEHTILDFTQFNNQSLFLVSGPTGSGKTTIFDAIAYALYDSPSGESRNKDAFKSDFATDMDLCKVAFTFEVNGKEYYIERIPNQTGPGARGPKNIASSVLFRDGDIVTTKIKEANQEIAELLSINYEQFKQIVMLPQGEFKRLLESDSKNKEVIFRNIFGTEVILAFQEQLKKQVAQLNKKVEHNQVRLQSSLAYLPTLEDEELTNLVETEDYSAIIQRLSLLQQKRIEETNKINEEQTKQTLKMRALERHHEEKGVLEDLEEKIKQLADKETEFNLLEIKIKQFENAQACLEAKHQLDSEKEEEMTLTAHLLNTTNAINETKEKITAINSSFVHVEKDYQALPEWREQEQQLKENIAIFKQLDQLQEELDLLTSQEHTNQLDLDNLILELAQVEQDSKAIAQTIKKIQDSHIQISEIKEKLTKQKTIQTSHETRENDLNRMARLLDNYEQAKLNMQTEEQTFNSKNKAFTEATHQFNQNIAGLLASKMEENQACPVCGSLDHPAPAPLINHAPTEADLQTLQVDVSEVQMNYSQAAARVGSLNNQLRELENQLSIQRSSLSDKQVEIQIKKAEVHEKITDLNIQLEELQIMTQAEETIQSKQTDLRKKEKTLLIRQAQLETDQERNKNEKVKKENQYQLLEKSVLDLEHARLEEEIKDLSEKIKETEKNYPLLKSQITDLEKQLAIYENTLSSQEKQIQAIKKRMILAEKNYQEKLSQAQLDENFEDQLLPIDQVESSRTKLSEYQDTVKITHSRYQEQLTVVASFGEHLDAQTLQNQLQESSKIVDQLKREYQHLATQLDAISQVLTTMKTTYEEGQLLMDKFGHLQRISDIANGKSTETGRLSFERYVLAIYYEEIVLAANQRLAQMTANRYLLQRSERESKGAGAKGLELDVFDHYTGQIRSVKTLSGGESFKASLALALGLSDVMQQQSGGVQIDTLFIDEGFGTLDSESLEQAIQTLAELNANGRMIGIISHVDELKTRIPAHIKVTHSTNGSQAEIIV